jgi:hypothetical protein
MSKSNLSVGNQGWVDRINAAWRKAATAYIDIGNMLIESKDAVKHGEWLDLLGKLDFDKRTAQKLMEIARDERLAKASTLTLLPQHWTTLYELTRLGDDEFERALSVGGITKQTKPRKPAVTDAEYHDVTQSPGGLPEPGVAVSAGGGSEITPLAPAEPFTPHDDREGGDSVVIETCPKCGAQGAAFICDTPGCPVNGGAAWPDADDGLQGHYHDSAAIHEAVALADSLLTDDWADGETQDESPPEGMVAIWVDPHDPMSMFSKGLMLAMDGSTTVNITDAAAEWSENMVLRTNELHDFIDLLIEFEAAYRAQHGNGNAAAL